MAGRKTSLKISAVSISGSGDNTVITAPSQGGIEVYGLYLFVDGDTDIIFKNGSIALSGSLPFFTATQTNIQPTIWPIGEEPWFFCDVGNNFIINNSAAVVVTGSIYYTLG